MLNLEQSERHTVAYSSRFASRPPRNLEDAYFWLQGALRGHKQREHFDADGASTELWRSFLCWLRRSAEAHRSIAAFWAGCGQEAHMAGERNAAAHHRVGARHHTETANEEFRMILMVQDRLVAIVAAHNSAETEPIHRLRGL